MLVLFLAMFLTLPAFATEPAPTNAETYLKIYTAMGDAEHTRSHGTLEQALEAFQSCYTQLLALHQSDPEWEKALVLARLSDLKANILDLQKRVLNSVAATVPSTNQPPIPAVANKIEEKPTSIPLSFIVFTDTPARTKISHSWKTGIFTTKFWIGEDGSGSAWDPKWSKTNGGKDTPDYRNGYASGDHASQSNPFYISLPFNDLTNPEKAAKWVSPGWARKPKDGKPVSGCKDRWVQIKNAQGRSCYAQWEDAGPGRTDQAEYVFGHEPPDPKTKAGMNVSPAVAQYLGFEDAADSTVSWRFVEEEDVRPGEWLKYDELALVYRGLHQQENGKAH